uniref:Retrotransposon Copia-like N-terminal domain-containing protein n=1 Tax=Lactuca sativa TaxID=4236 RepID=A0A9R1X0G8_LACSA|nr:hypothetical protein LSAT_V11C800440020 [Lactuca sativa]
MASSSSNSHVTLEVGEQHTYTYPYPYPSNPSATVFTTVKLSRRDEYGMWKTQMLCLLESHGMLGFINGTFMCPQPISISGKEKVGDHQTHYRMWRRSDALVKEKCKDNHEGFKVQNAPKGVDLGLSCNMVPKRQ